MSAAQDNLARWREAEQGATEGPWWLCLTGPAIRKLAEQHLGGGSRG